ncbi:MAG TPA: amidase family protein [Gemmatimonadota bacterium]|nr:amidase family protein [Gemmatimonadota bacterium]
MSDLACLDATTQADLVRRGEVTPLELIDAAIARIERGNPTLNAVVTPTFPKARETARGELPDGPFRGVPFLLKDLSAAWKGVRMTSGSAFLADYAPPVDSVLVERYRAAGLVFLGKTNCPEFGFLPTTEPALHGPTRNPWDLDRSPGGSSGGSAAAVAAGMVPFAHGNDGGGSIRIPASCCGLVGLKPTRARVTHAPLVGDVMSGLVVAHALTRTVRDSAALLDATAGPAPGDPYRAPAPARPFLDEVGADSGRLRIAWSAANPIGATVDPDCVRAVEDAAALCESLGHDVVEAAPALDGELLYESFLAAWTAGHAWGIDAMARATGRSPEAGSFEPLTWALYRLGREVRAADYLLAITALQGIARQVAGFFAGHDVWLTPTLAEPPPPLGTFDGDSTDALAVFRRASEFVPFTPLFNATGQPAISLPLHWSAAGLPIGVQFAGRFGDEAALIRLAAALEEARPWAERIPPAWLGG